jgi:hypothetical protein
MVFLASAHTLREIHSLKLTEAARRARVTTFTLIALTTVATCLAFFGIDRLAQDLNLSTELVNAALDLFLLGLLIAVIVELSWRFTDRASEHQRAIVVLTSFIRDLENRLRQPVELDDDELVDRFSERHGLIIEILPAHTDRDYLRAKNASESKMAARAAAKKRHSAGLAKAESGES